MKVSEAREIVGHMCEWFFYQQGIKDEMPDKMDYSLEEMLKANKIVERANKRVMSKPGRHKIQTIIADRGIAAMYVAMSFSASNPKGAESIACANGKFVFVIK